jgi:prolyl-tRNA synthetase
MRGREFLMKDAYSFDIDGDSARRSYQKMFLAYLRTFARLGMKAIPMQADTGPIGGDLSHEFIILAETGESGVFCDKEWLDLDVLESAPGFADDLGPFFEKYTSIYAATDEKHDPASSPVPEGELVNARGIEVGHIFYFGTKYSAPMGAMVAGPNGEQVAVEMGSYGIGVSRLVAAIIEASHDEHGIVWPDAVAPFRIGLVNLKPGDEKTDEVAEGLYARLLKAGNTVLYDDLDARAGAKFAAMDLIGLPWQVIVGPKGAGAGEVEIKRRATGERRSVHLDAAVNQLVHAAG